MRVSVEQPIPNADIARKQLLTAALSLLSEYGWVTLGHHVDAQPIPDLEFSSQRDDGGDPYFERPIHWPAETVPRLGVPALKPEEVGGLLGIARASVMQAVARQGYRKQGKSVPPPDGWWNNAPWWYERTVDDFITAKGESR